MFRRFLLLLTPILLSACVTSGGGYTRSPVVTPLHLSCFPGGDASVTTHSPSEATLVVGGKAYTLKRKDTDPGSYFKGNGAEYWNKGAYSQILIGKDLMQCDPVPDDL